MKAWGLGPTPLWLCGIVWGLVVTHTSPSSGGRTGLDEADITVATQVSWWLSLNKTKGTDPNGFRVHRNACRSTPLSSWCFLKHLWWGKTGNLPTEIKHLRSPPWKIHVCGMLCKRVWRRKKKTVPHLWPQSWATGISNYFSDTTGVSKWVEMWGKCVRLHSATLWCVNSKNTDILLLVPFILFWKARLQARLKKKIIITKINSGLTLAASEAHIYIFTPNKRFTKAQCMTANLDLAAKHWSEYNLYFVFNCPSVTNMHLFVQSLQQPCCLSHLWNNGFFTINRRKKCIIIDFSI